MSSLLRLKRIQNKFFNTIRILIFLFRFYSFGIETITTFIRSRGFFAKTMPDFRLYTHFQTKKAQEHTYMAYTREYPPSLRKNPFLLRSSPLGTSPAAKSEGETNAFAFRRLVPSR